MLDTIKSNYLLKITKIFLKNLLFFNLIFICNNFKIMLSLKEKEKRMSKLRVVKEFFQYIIQNKKLWLIPLIIILALVGIVVLVSQSQAIAPFIYSLF